MEKTYYLLTKYTKEVELSEIDFDLYEEALGKNWEDDKVEITKTAGGSWEGESYPININKVINILNELKEKGSSHVEIMYHCDHIGYVFNGAEIRRANDTEVLEHLKYSDTQEQEDKKREIELLEKRLKELKG